MAVADKSIIDEGLSGRHYNLQYETYADDNRRGRAPKQFHWQAVLVSMWHGRVSLTPAYSI